MRYYIFVENGKINGCGQCECLNEDIYNCEVEQEIYNDFVSDNLKYIAVEKEVEVEVPDEVEEGEEQTYHTETQTAYEIVPNPNYEQEKAAKREADFNKAFFITSLGYVRRSVKMADGSHKDFLSDLLSAIATSVQMGKTVNIYTYDKPPFDVDIEDWTEYQHLVSVTPQFINECFTQLSADFAPINNEDK